MESWRQHSGCVFLSQLSLSGNVLTNTPGAYLLGDSKCTQAMASTVRAWLFLSPPQPLSPAWGELVK